MREPVEHQALELKRAGLAARTRKKIARLATRLVKIDADLRAALEHGFFSERGELLKANLRFLKRGMERIDVRNFTDDSIVTIELAPEKSPRENLELFFRRARKLKRMGEFAARRRTGTEHEIAALEDLIAKVLAAPDTRTLDELEEKFFPPPRTDVKIEREKIDRKGIVTWRTQLNGTVLVGKTAAANTRLVARVANGRDYWFHTKDMTGPHVLLRVAGKSGPPPEDMLDAMNILLFSMKKTSDTLELYQTECKNVRPIPNAPGRVGIARAKTISFVFDPARMKKILEANKK